MPWETMAVLSESVTESPEGWAETGKGLIQAIRRQGADFKKKNITTGAW